MEFLMDLRSGKRRRRSPFLLFPGLLCGAVLTSGLAGQTTTSRPGENDPISSPEKLTLFPDQELFAFSPEGQGEIKTQLYRMDSDKNLSLSNLDYKQPVSNLNPIVAASGRILEPDRANVVFAQRVWGKSEIEVQMRGDKSVNSVRISGLADRGRGYYDIDNIAIATGDLDQAIDSKDNYHDEVAVAYSSTSGTYKLAVLNYTNWDRSPATIATIDVGPDDSADPNFISCDIPIGVAIGDVDGDGINELVVATIRSSLGIGIRVFRYVSDEKGGGGLKEKSTFTLPTPLLAPDSTGQTLYTVSKVHKTISIQMADINGDGADELVIGYVCAGPLEVVTGSSKEIYQLYTPELYMVRLNHLFQPEHSNYVFEKTGLGGNPQSPEPVRAQVAAGQFLFNPNGNPSIPFGQRQIAIAWNDTSVGSITIHAYSVASNDLKPTPIGSTVFAGPPVNSGFPNQQFSFVAGGFTGNANINQPTAQLAVSAWTPRTHNSGQYWIRTIAVKPQGLSLADFRSFSTIYPDQLYRVPLVAVDWDGKSVYLGAPAHITLENVVSTDYILEEPPKHSFWDEALHKVTNVSNYDSNHVSFSYSTGKISSSKSTDSSNQTVGGSAAASAGATVGTKTNALLVQTSTEVSTDVSTKASYEYDKVKESYDSQARSRTFIITSTTDHDDYLHGNFQLIDVWRYRVYGLTNTDAKLNTFYDIMLPGPIFPFSKGGLAFDWYQPIHENGNILTYPQMLSRSGTDSDILYPSDLGSYTDSDGNSVTEPLVESRQWAFDGTGGTQKLDLSTAGGKGHSVNYTHKTAESVDVTAGFKTSVKVGPVKASARASASVGFSNQDSWGSAETSENTTTTETMIEMTKGSGDSTQSYSFDPLLYITKDGTFKMSFFVSNPASKSNTSGKNFWAAE